MKRKEWFARLFEVGGQGGQLLVYREHDAGKDVTIVHHITEASGAQIDSSMKFRGEGQERAAQCHIDELELDDAERIYLALQGLVDAPEGA
ncbi:MAG: hypothetical protein IH614_13705 [Desulfuromonadales bacterium]|nr:hypothetical protein [Desulfuromonadales bacterium]